MLAGIILIWMMVVASAIVWTEVNREMRRRNDQR